MADYYPYVIASLPMLQFGMKPPFSFGRFLELCHGFIPEKDFRLLCALPQPEHYQVEGDRPGIIRKWIKFDTALRNELVRVRAGRKHREAAEYLRPGGSIAPADVAAGMHASLLEAEMAIDRMRWNALEGLAAGHYFDLDSLVTYAYRLLILHRWENVRNAVPRALLEQALQHSR